MRSLRARLLAAFLLPTLSLFAIFGIAGYVLARSILEEELGRSLAAVAAAAASQVNAERLLTIAPEDDSGYGTRTYRNVLKQLTEIRTAAGARRLFAFDEHGRVRMDAGGDLPVGAEVPELARDRLELTQILAGQPAWSQVLFEGSDGLFYKTGYAPIWKEGKVAGAVGVEGSAQFFVPLRRLSRGYLALVGSSLVLLAVLAVLTARGVTAPITRLVDAALRIGRGDLETTVRPEPTLEIGILARELEEMRTKLAARDRQLKMMLAGVAHEVRNPIGGIELFAGLLAEDPGGDEAGAHVARIRAEIEYLKRIVEDFLAFARDQRLALAPIDVRVVLEEARALLHAEAASRPATVRVEAAAATLDADHALLVAAMVNLIKNAIQASPPGGEVSVTGQRAGERYTVEVRDGGAGIAPDSQERIFEPFFTTRAQGTGLGLPLARKILQAHHGSLSVRSTPGETVFTVELPLR